MKAFIFAASLLALTSTAFAGDVGVSVSVGQPGFYGRIDIGDFPQPRIIYQQPVIIERPVRYVEQQPIYLHVPPGHAKKWSKHCHKYNACGQRVYFVKDDWYVNEYAPRYREKHGERYEREDRNDHGHNEKRGRGHGKGHDKD